MILNARRNFLKQSFLGTAVLVMSANKLFGAVSPLQTLALVWEDLFAHAKENTPYISLILNHSRVSDEEKQFLRNGVQWLNEEAVVMYKQMYAHLDSSQRQEVLQSISDYRWGNNWIEMMLTYIMEATLGDPVYGINKEEGGWKWLHHVSGVPRPKEPLL
ncbi:gluconate 2-dehydrogenase subunit 3 family protein [bacterium]|nr:gluconate 2-dehydrogenase subunit 3 family protein [bacterium]MBU1991261.1 gluconate 2-dehydrogenase subunit 3 family protein [bacterium]